jgi:hypothetical protein
VIDLQRNRVADGVETASRAPQISFAGPVEKHRRSAEVRGRRFDRLPRLWQNFFRVQGQQEAYR